MSRQTLVASVCMFVAIGSASVAFATVIPVTNPSFNATPPLGTPPSFTFTMDLSTVSGWTSGASNYTAGVENAGANISPNDGSTLYLNFNGTNGTATQTLAATESSGTYTLQAFVGNRSDRSSTAPTMSLLDNGVAISPTMTNDPFSSGTLSLWTQTYVIPTGNAGVLGIRFTSGGGNANEVDNVSLSLAATPEPSSLILCGLGAIGLFVAARRRRRKV